MAIALISRTKRVGTSASPDIDTSLANWLGAIVVFVGTSSTTITLTDNKGNGTPTRANTYSNGSISVTLLYWENPVSVGSGHNFTVAESGIAPVSFPFSLSGALTSSSLGGQTGGSAVLFAPPDTQATGSLTPADGGAFLISGIASANGPDGGQGHNVVTSGWTSDFVNRNSGVNLGAGFAYYAQAVAAASNPEWAVTGGAVDCGFGQWYVKPALASGLVIPVAMNQYRQRWGR